MPTFETPEPISVTLELGVGYVRIAASDRADTVVEVRPSDEADESDVHAAQQVRVDYTNGMLRVTGPKLRGFDFSRKTRSVDVSIELPTGSQVSAEVQMGDFGTAGRLGECRFKTGAGHARLERTGPLRLHTGAGHITVDGVAGNAEFSTGNREGPPRRDRGHRGRQELQRRHRDRYGHRRRPGTHGQRRYLHRPGRREC